MQFQELIEYCQAEAIANKFHPTDESTWRYFCRTYSKLFNTPLPQVEQMEVLDVILNVYEEEFDGINTEDNLESLLDIIYSLEDPDYVKFKKDELKQFIKDSEEEEDIRQELGKPIHPALKSSLPTEPSTDKEFLPQQGSINLSYLEKEETEGDFE